MYMITLFLGGCRSGKSTAALNFADQLGAERKIFVATCQPHDDEMRARVARHQAERDRRWETIEAPVDLVGMLRAHTAPQTVMLVDCLTLWLTNLMVDGAEDAEIEQHVEAFVDALQTARGPIVLVANEVGLGLVPDNALGRRFRDWAGSLNQRIAGCSHRVVFTVAGIPMTIKTTDLEDKSSHP